MVTWEQWWEKMFQDNYREYTDKQMAKKKATCVALVENVVR